MSGTIGYLGPQGTFSEEALIAWIGVMYWGRMLTFFRPPFVVPPQ